MAAQPRTAPEHVRPQAAPRQGVGRPPAGSPIVVLGFVFGAMAMFATMYGTQAILPDLSQSFHVSPDRAGLTVSTAIVAIALFAWVWGPISDRWGRKRSMVVASAALVLPTAASGLSPSFEALLAVRAVQGACMPGLVTAAMPYVREVFMPRLGSRAMGYWLGALVAGGLIGRVGVALATAEVGWRWALSGLAVLPLVGTFLLARTLPEAPSGSEDESTVPAVRAHLANPVLLAAMVAACGLFFVFVAVFSFVTYRLEAPPFALSTVVASLVFLLWGLGAIGPVAGRLADRWGWPPVLAGGLGLAALSTLVTLPGSLVLIGLGLAGLTVGMFCGSTAAQTGVTAAARSHRGTAAALYFSAFYVAGALGGWLPGRILASAGWTGLVVLTCAAVAVAGAAMGLLLVRAR